MAGLTGRVRRDSVGGDSRSRGQLLLVSAFALAALLLALAVALNAATYTESLATRPDGVDDRDVLAFQYGVERGVEGVILATNAQRPTESNRTTLLESNVGNWTRLASRQAAADATTVDVEVNETTLGTRVWQNNSSRSLTNASGAGNWTVASGVNATREFRMNVSRTSLANASCPSGCFAVVATNNATDWRLTATANDTTITVTVDGPTGNESCSVRANATTVDLSAGTLVGERCDLPPFAAGVEGPYDVVYAHGDEAAGTYAFVVDESKAEATNDSSFDPSPPGPNAHPAVWSAQVELTYRTSNVAYSRTIRIVPGEDDE